MCRRRRPGATASGGGGGGSDGGAPSVGADGILTRGGVSRSDMGFLTAERGCKPFALDGNKVLDLLGDPQTVVQTNDYIGTLIYALSAGTHRLTMRSSVGVVGMDHEALPTTTIVVQARHFYAVDCVHTGDTVDVSITERDHLGRRNN